MPTYIYKCQEHGWMEVSKPMADYSRVEYCPDCGKALQRVYYVPSVIYKSDGFHHTDYGKGRLHRTGDKNDNLNANWHEATGETPPPPAKDVPRSGSKY